MSQQMPEDFLLQFSRVIRKGRQDAPTPPGWPQWRTIIPLPQCGRCPQAGTGQANL